MDYAFNNIKHESSMNFVKLYKLKYLPQVSDSCFRSFWINTLLLPVGEKAVFSIKSNTSHGLFLAATLVEIGNCFFFDKVHWTFDIPNPHPPAKQSVTFLLSKIKKNRDLKRANVRKKAITHNYKHRQTITNLIIFLRLLLFLNIAWKWWFP